MNLKEKILVIVVLICGLQVFAQSNFRFKHWGVEDGLSQSTITQLVQDKDGFIWLGTQDGLNRFDGYRFTVFRKKENDVASLSNNYVMSLVCDSIGDVWVGTTNGLNRISRRSGKVNRIGLEKLFPNASNFRIHSLCAAERGGVYVATSFSILFVDTVGNIFHLPEIQPILPSGSNSMVFDGSSLFFAAGKKIWQYNVHSHAVSAISAECLEVNVLSVRAHRLIYRCGQDLMGYDLAAKKPFKYPVSARLQSSSTRNIQSILQLGNEDWLCTDNGLIWRRENDTLLITHNEKNQTGLSSDFVYAALRDKANNIWIGTGRGGLCLFSNVQQQVLWLGKNMALNEAVWHTLLKNDTLYLATSKGLKIYRQKFKKLNKEAILFPEKYLQEISLPALQQPLQDKLITAVDCDVQGNLWVSTERNGVYCYSAKTRGLKNFLSTATDTTSLITDRCMYLEVLNDSTVAICSALGVSLMNTNSGTVKRLYLSALVPGLNNYVMKAKANEGFIWFSSANGLGKYELKSARLTNYMPDAKHPEEQYHNIVSDARPGANGKVWLTTMGYGLHCFDEKTGRFTRFGSREGLENENLLRLLIASDGNIWTASHDGISYFDVTQNRFYSYGEEEGFENKECTMNGFYESEEGDCYVGTVGGLAVFDPKILRPDTAYLKMVLTSIKVNYSETYDDEAATIEGVQASPSTITLYDKAKTVEFEFSGLRFAKIKAISYRYRLLGFDQQWVQLPNFTRFASYTNLPEGRYTFQVVPVLQGRAIYSKLLQFELKVVPPFYKTMWFKLLSIVIIMFLVAAGIAFFYRRKLRVQKEKAEQELRLQKEKERISRELHDNVGSQLTYIIKSIDTLSYKTNKQPERVQEGLDSLSDFSRDTLNQLRESIWAINTKEITLRELEAKIQDHVSKVAARVAGIELILQTDITDDLIINPAKAIGIFRIVQEALVNSIKYANCASITIHFRQVQGSVLSVVISDNGIGFDATLVKTHSYGLKNMRARAEEIGAEFSIESASGLGTKVELRCQLP